MRDVVELEAAPVEVSGLSEVGTFSILANGKAFKILIDGLYSDKPRAIVRELCTNAFDAHVMAGIADRPFQVHIPTRFNPHFSVRDFGISLTHKDVMTLYTTVFASTKDKDNTNVGKFGLGSKVPFAYTDSFAVTAILSGEKRTYNAFIDTDGIPKIALFSREETDEEQGVEVSFPVRSDDIQAFTTAFKRVILGFDVCPLNNIEVTQPEFEVIAQGAGWRIMKKDYELGLQGAYVKQGCVLYPIDANALSAVRHSSALATLRAEALILEMPIGSVEITPSRESIQYDTTTAKNILDKIDSILNEVVENIAAKMKSATTLFQATKIRKALLESISDYNLRQHVSAALKWRGRDLFDDIRISAPMVKSLQKHGVELRGAHYGKRSRRRAPARVETHDMGSCSFRADVLPTFVYWEGDDTPTHLGYRLAAAMRTISGGNMVVLPHFKPGGRAEQYLFAAFGRPDEELQFLDLTTVPFEKPDYQKTLASLKVWSENTGRFEDGVAPRIDQDDVYFCHTYKNVPKRDNREVGLDVVSYVWRNLKAQHLLPAGAVLVGIPASRKDIANNIPDAWDDFFDATSELVKNTFDAAKAAKAQAAQNIASEGDAKKWIALFDAMAEATKPVTSDSLFWNARETVAPYLDKGDGPLHLALKNLLSSLFSQDEQTALLAGFDPKPHQQEFWNVIKPIRETYPLLRSILEHCFRWDNCDLEKADLKGLGDYIAMADAKDAAERADDVLYATF